MDDLLARLRRRLTFHEEKVRDLKSAIQVISEEIGGDLDSTGTADPPAANKTDRAVSTPNGTPLFQHQETNTESGTYSTKIGDLTGMKIAEAAQAILGALSADAWENYRTVARLAVENGYRGRDPHQAHKAIADSFYHTMKRHFETFENRGPIFRLKRPK